MAVLSSRDAHPLRLRMAPDFARAALRFDAAVYVIFGGKGDVGTRFNIKLLIEVALFEDRNKSDSQQHYTYCLPPSLDAASTLPITAARRSH
jgi:hypothetical protein